MARLKLRGEQAEDEGSHAGPSTPAERAQTFEEVALGYSEEEAVLEARRCIQCPDTPCVGGCPVGVPIPRFVEQVAQGNFAARLRYREERERASRHLRARVPAGVAVRGPVHAR